jgi:hypothetical protein
MSIETPELICLHIMSWVYNFTCGNETHPPTNLIGLAAFKQSRSTLASVSSPLSVVKSMQVTALHSQAACHSI